MPVAATANKKAIGRPRMFTDAQEKKVIAFCRNVSQHAKKVNMPCRVSDMTSQVIHEFSIKGHKHDSVIQAVYRLVKENTIWISRVRPRP